MKCNKKSMNCTHHYNVINIPLGEIPRELVSPFEAIPKTRAKQLGGLARVGCHTPTCASGERALKRRLASLAYSERGSYLYIVDDAGDTVNALEILCLCGHTERMS